MSSGVARWALAHLDGWTWLVAEYRAWLITLATVIGLAVPVLAAAGKRLPRPAPSLVIRGGAMALAFSAATVTICCLLHFSDLRWLAPGQRATAHLSAPGGLFGFGKPIVACDQFSRGHPGRVPGNPGVSPRRYRLRVLGAGGFLRGGHNLAPCPSRRYQADRARRNTQVNCLVRAGTAIGCP